MKNDTTDKTVKALNVAKKMMPCLQCGKMILTDRCHRFCQRCARSRGRKSRSAWRDEFRVRVFAAGKGNRRHTA